MQHEMQLIKSANRRGVVEGLTKIYEKIRAVNSRPLAFLSFSFRIFRPTLRADLGKP